jgi:hypothetical protein
MSERRIVVINLWDNDCGECPMCDRERQLRNAVAWWCGPVRHEIGAKLELTDGTIQEVGGMPVCKECHDDFYAEPRP